MIAGQHRPRYHGSVGPEPATSRPHGKSTNRRNHQTTNQGSPMCGRGGLDYDWKTLWEWLKLPGAAPSGHVRQLNFAPSTRRSGEVRWTRIPVVRIGDDRQRRVDEMIWPLIPAWLRGELPKFSTANCRSEVGQPFGEVVAKKPSFRNAWRRGRRCLVPLNWFYEWDQRSTPRQPWRVLPKHEPLLVLAGLWERGHLADGRALESFTVITTGPNRLLREIGHDRAPVLLHPADFESWLEGDESAAESLIAPPDDDSLTAHRVTMRVNNPEYQGEDLLEPLNDAEHGG
jgi:putative SOS response-associated peptidase YedK